MATPNTSIVITAMPSAPCRLGPSRRIRRRLASTARWPNVIANSRNAASPITVRSVPPTDTSPAVAKPAKTASITHPTTSLAMPAATVIWPKSRLISPSSDRIRAITAKADTDSAAATNRANTVRSAATAHEIVRQQQAGHQASGQRHDQAEAGHQGGGPPQSLDQRKIGSRTRL